MNDLTRVYISDAAPFTKQRDGEVTPLESYRAREQERQERDSAYLTSLHSGAFVGNLSSGALNRQLEIDDISDEMGM